MSVAPNIPLLACPFCASTELMILPHRFSIKEVWYEPTCKACGAGCGPAPSVADGCVKWNTRRGTNERGDVAKALPISAVVFGMMHEIPIDKLAAEIQRRGGL